MPSAPESYAAAWFAFDNATGATRPLGETASRDLTLQGAGRAARGERCVHPRDLHAGQRRTPAWARPVRAFFKKVPAGWALVGLERMPEPDRVAP